jgi:rhodanese-related sulfurtransferase
MNKRKWMQWAGMVVLGMGSVTMTWAVETPATLAGAKVIGAEDAKKLLDGGTPFFDTRVSAEYAEKTIKGAKGLTYREKSAKVADFDAGADQFDLSKLPADKATPVVFFCNAGECWRSYKASAVAIKNGYSKVNWFRGGMPEWTAKGLPTQ